MIFSTVAGNVVLGFSSALLGSQKLPSVALYVVAFTFSSNFDSFCIPSNSIAARVTYLIVWKTGIAYW